MSLNPIHGKVYSIQHYVTKLVSDLQQVSGFLWVLPISYAIKTDRHDITEILLKVALKTIYQNQNQTMFVIVMPYIDFF